MPHVPSSLIAAVLCSAAAGKNPWVPFGLIALVAAPASVPEFLIDPAVQARLHSVAPGGVLWGVAALMLLLAALESFGDKVPGVEQWLVPLSSAWRPFAAMGVASLVAWAGMPLPATPTPLLAELGSIGEPTALQAQLVSGTAVTWAVLTVVLGTLAGYLASVGKVGVRLLLTFVPIPGLKLAHVTGPLLARLASIYLRILLSLIRRANPDAQLKPPPGWVLAAAQEHRADAAHVLRAYTFRAVGVGRARHGYLVFGERHVLFVHRRLFRVHKLVLPETEVRRLGLAESATVRCVAITSGTAEALIERRFYLFPADADEVVPAIRAGAGVAGLVAVRARSESARAGLPGYRVTNGRYRPARVAGDLRLQALTTLASAAIVGVLTMGVYIPIGAGYVFSPFPRRFAISTGLSIYLALCALGTGFVALPVTVAYGVMLNAIALRDLTRQAASARIDGRVDKRAFLPLPAQRVWVPPRQVSDPADRGEDEAALMDGSWRVVWAALAAAPPV